MPLIVPDALEAEILRDKLTPPLTMKLYSNNVTPDGSTTAGAFIEVSGGGYASKPLLFANWVISEGDPSIAVYNITQSWTFTGATSPPGTIFGYFITRNSDGKLMWSEKFPAIQVPFIPENGSVVKVLPRFSAQSQF